MEKKKKKIWGHQINFLIRRHYKNAEFTIKGTENDKFKHKKLKF